jgi:hypothetical protein
LNGNSTEDDLTDTLMYNGEFAVHSSTAAYYEVTMYRSICRLVIFACSVVLTSSPIVAQVDAGASTVGAESASSTISVGFGSAAYGAEPPFYTVTVEGAWAKSVTARTALRVGVGVGRTIDEGQSARTISPYFVQGTFDAMFAVSHRREAVMPYLLLGATAGWYQNNEKGGRVFYIEGNEPSSMKAVFGPVLGGGIILPIGKAVALTTEVRIGKNLVEPSQVDMFFAAAAGMGWTF